MGMATITRKGRKFVLVPVEEFERINGRGLPPFPPIDSDGSSNAIDFARLPLSNTIASIVGRVIRSLPRRNSVSHAVTDETTNARPLIMRLRTFIRTVYRKRIKNEPHSGSHGRRSSKLTSSFVRKAWARVSWALRWLDFTAPTVPPAAQGLTWMTSWVTNGPVRAV
jgi:hypothetical protein